MARKRMIDPTIWADEDFNRLSSDGKIMFIGLISNADDEGRLPGNAGYLGSIVFPYAGMGKERATKIRNEVLEIMGSVVLYEIEGKEYLQFTKWESYQSINRPTPSKYPPLREDSVRTHGGLHANRIEENRIEENRIEENRIEENRRKKDSPTESNYVNDFREWLDYFNEKQKTKYRSEALLPNYSYWRESYSKEEMIQAIDRISAHEWLRDKAKPELLLRRTDTHQNPVNRIGELLSIQADKVQPEMSEYDKQLIERTKKAKKLE